MAERPITNAEIADVLERVADLLEAQEANRYRVRAYRTAAEAIRQHHTQLAQILHEGGVEAVDALPAIGPTIAALLVGDAGYRERAAKRKLRRITPRRFNPERRAWLPILHTERDGWQLAALFSNTARAHELGKTRDWVIIFYSRDGDEGQCTVVTETRGPLAGRRVVRGRETECRAHYAPVASAHRSSPPEVR